MSSEKPKPRGEERLYKPIKDLLQSIFASWYIEPEKRYQSAPFEHEENPYLRVIGRKKRFPETLEKEFDTETLNIVSDEGKFPDIVGYVQKKRKSQKEIITVEVKDKPIKLKHIAQAKFYQDIFNAAFGLLISSEGIPERKVRYVLETKGGRAIRGKVIIAQVTEKPAAQYGYFTSLEINSKFKDSVPEPFKRFCKS